MRNVSGVEAVEGGYTQEVLWDTEDEELVLKCAKECGKIVTAEEHNVIGGLGEAVCSLLSEKLPTPVRRVGVQDKFGCSGPAWDLLKLYGLDAATICKTAKEMLGR